jgi:ribose transport system substrate-binding protein
MFKKGTFTLVILLVVSMVMTACAPEQASVSEPAETTSDGYTIGFAVSTLANPFFVSMKDGGEVKAAELGIELITLDAQDDNEKQAAQIQDLISREVDLIIVNPVDSDAIAPAVKEINNAGIPVITVTRPSNGGEVVQHLDIDNSFAGKLVADELIKVLDGTGKVAILEGIAGTPSATARQAGFVDVVNEVAGIEVVTSLTANYSREEAASVMEDVLQANPELDAVYAHNDEMALGAVRAIAAAGRQDEIKVFGIDATDDALTAIAKGEMVATVKQQPAVQMAMAVEAAKAVLDGETVDELVIVPLVLVNADNLPEDLAGEETAAEEPAERFTIGFAVSTLANPFFVSMKEGGEAKAAELGIELITLDAQDNNEKQASQIQDLISRAVDLIIINPVDSDAIAPAVKEINNAGIPVITVTRPSNGGEVVQHLDIDNAFAGKLVAEELIKVLNGSGKVAILEGIAGTPSATARQEGFITVVDEVEGIEVVSSLTANYSREEAASVMEDVLQANPELDAVYAHNDEMALGAVRAIVAAGRLDEIKVFGIDATDDALTAIEKGEMVATVKQQPAVQMAMAVEAAFAVLNGETVDELVIVPLVLVNAENLP